MPSALATSSSASSVERDDGELGGRVGVGDRAADGAAVANLEVADELDRLGEERRVGGDRRVTLDRRLASDRADRDLAVLALDAVELGDAVHVDQMREARQPQCQHRHEALAAGEHLGVVAVLTQESDDIAGGLGRVVLERRWLQLVPPGCVTVSGRGSSPRPTRGVNI